MKRLFFLFFLFIGCFATLGAAEDIHQAISAANLDEVKNLILESAENIEIRDADGNTPLLSASISGSIDIVRYLIKNGSDIKAINNRQSTALHLAVYENHPAIVEYLLTLGLDINALNAGGFSPLMFASYNGHRDVTEILVKKGADMAITDPQWGGMAFHWGCIKGNRETLEYLASQGVDYNIISVTDSSTPIFWAANAGNVEVISYLLENRVKADYEMPNGWTPLHNAARSGHIDAVRLLVENGAQITKPDNDGNTPFNSSVERGDIEVVTFFLENGADANSTNSDNMSALHWAALRGNLELAQMFIERGADVNVVDSFGTTPLTRAAHTGNIEIAKMLIEKGADVNFRDEDDKTPIMATIKLGNIDLVRLLLDNGATVNHKDNNFGRSELHQAAIKGYGEIVNLLIAKGADIGAVDNDDQRPLYYANRYGHNSIAKTLENNNGKTVKNSKYSLKSSILKKTLAHGDAVIWYLGHCGFAIKTSDHLLIFDYWNRGNIPDEPGLANGRINPEELKGQNVFVFVTHEHRDHFDTSIFDWRSELDNVTYIYGFKPEQLMQYRDSGYTGPAYEFVGPHDEKTIGGLKISTIEANDAGVGFYVEVDGVNLYHAGDHAGWRNGEREQYLTEIDYLTKRVGEIDFAFINVTGCHVGDTAALAESVSYALEKLKPKYWFPTHGLDREHEYLPFTQKTDIARHKSKPICTENRGDCYIVKNGNIL
ncbi:MAG: ankyrin repeat domain-containing protein [candidate division Zixibacteria bacterium]|nr:ankyrin repeat domain-containing protein [candidate division Zixibacteria bacterium]